MNCSSTSNPVLYNEPSDSPGSAPRLDTSQSLNLEELLPHREPMLFLEEVLERSQHSARTRLTVGRRGIRPGHNNELCASIAIEYIAQTAALTGEGPAGEAPASGRRSGYLIGVRELSSGVSSFKIGQILQVTAHLDGEGPSLKTFTGAIEDELTGVTLVTAKFSVYEEDTVSTEAASFPCLKRPADSEALKGE